MTDRDNGSRHRRAGYIGSHTVRRLMPMRRAVALDRRVPAGSEPAGVEFVLGDVRDRSVLDQVFERWPIDGVVHFEAGKNVGESVTTGTTQAANAVDQTG